MNSSVRISLIICLLQALLLSLCSSKSIVPAVKESTKDADKPIGLDAAECPEGMVKVSESDTDKAIGNCRCQRGKFFYQPTKSCYSPYLRSPCKENEYSVPSEDGKDLLCKENPCKEDGVVPFQGGCHKLNERGPCNEQSVLKLSPLTSKLDCTFDLKHLLPASVIVGPQKCPDGQRYTGSKCTEAFV